MVSSGESSGVPARGYSWAAFAAGHRKSVTSGVHSRGLVAERAEQVRQWLLSAPGQPSYLGEARFAVMLDKFSADVAMWLMAGEYIDRIGFEPAFEETVSSDESSSVSRGRGERRVRSRRLDSPLKEYRALGRAVVAGARELGLTPGSAAQIMRDLGVVARQQDAALEQLGREGHAMWEEQQEMRAAGYKGMTLGRYKELKAAGTLPPPPGEGAAG